MKTPKKYVAAATKRVKFPVERFESLGSYREREDLLNKYWKKAAEKAVELALADAKPTSALGQVEEPDERGPVRLAKP